ncbi:MAG: VCBS repeat-containing protein [Bacteroidales bacterium]|nr:VCBS repeat-containing protein [Bacteroidales bacterium]
MKKLIYTLLLMTVSVTWAQDNNEIDPPKEDGKVVVGAIGGFVDVAALGGASYSIPIQVPEGIGGMQPNLSIVYNSQGGNGLLGWGWNLGGLSAITRVGHTLYHDGYVDGVDFDGDRFALDGQRLFALDAVEYGSNGTEYKTESDGMNKIVSYTETIHVGGGGMFGHGSYSYKIISHFKVYTADGKILYYGKVDDEPDNARVIFESNGRKKVVMWLLKRVEDRRGNYMVYNYDIGSHDYRLNNIQYSGHPGDKSTVYGIDFHYYRNRVDKESAAIGNFFLYQPCLLKDISIYHWSRPLSKYEFTYDNNSGQLDSHNYYNRLTEIRYEHEGLSFNPTIISWREYPEINNGSNNMFFSSIDDMYVSPIEYNTQDPLTIDGVVKFSGDFNGDGLQDLICVVKDHILDEEGLMTDTIEMNRGVHRAHAFINKGNTKTDNEAGALYFEQIGTFEIPYNLRWVYICDLDGDGVDEVLLVGENTDVYWGRLSRANYDVFKLYPRGKEPVGEELGKNASMRFAAGFSPLANSDLTFSIFGDGSDYVWGNGDILEFTITEKMNYSFIVGDFLGKGHCDIIFTFPYKHFVYIYYDEQSGYFKQRTSVADWNGLRYVPGDFDGDGKTEVWFDSEFDEDPGVIAKVYINNEGRFSWYPLANMMDSWNRNFTGDFNGDGHTDFLTFRKDTKTWHVLLFKQDWHSYPVFDVTETMKRYFGEEDPDDANYSIEGKEGLDFFIEIADVDGDGKSDVMLRNKKGTDDCKFAVLYGPPVGNGFARIDEFDAKEIQIQMESTPGLCVGNFLGQENMALISKGNLYSFPQHSIYYNVDNITDGMGNRTSFDYGYLVHNPRKSDNIYDVDHIGQNLGYDLYNIPLHLKAVRTLTRCNIEVPTQAHAVDSFSYVNAIAHRKGKGLLGFRCTIRNSWMVESAEVEFPEAKHQSELVQTFSHKPMGEHRSLVPETETLYRYRDDGEKVKTASTLYFYRKGLCQRDMNSLGVKVFAPLVKTIIADEYELLGERDHLRRRITENEYDGQQQNGAYNYNNVIRVSETYQGTDAGTPSMVSNCEFQTATLTEYAPLLNSGDLWVPSRPLSVLTKATRRTPGYASSKSLTVYSYDNDRPYLPKFVTTYPSGGENENDPLAMTAYYTYYPSGWLKDESHYPVVGRSEDGFKTMYEYSPNYRFLTKKTEEYDPTHANDYHTLYGYDNVYGDLKTETDCNGYSTYTENPDHLGLTVRSYKRDNDATQSRIPGTETVTALRWLAGSAYQIHGEGLTSPSYFSWKQRSGTAETFTIYDAMGRELRTVSHGLSENGSDKIVYQDKQYDSWGRLAGVSEPYFNELPLNQRRWTTYAYGDFDRIDIMKPPMYTVDNQTIEPYIRYEYDGLTTTTTTGVRDNYDTHVTTTTLNVMGWTESNGEVIDGNGTENVTTYGHNADGSLAWAMVNGNEATKVTMHYDDAGNRRELHDPNYGKVTDHYNAFGQLVYTVTPKGDTTAYEYDKMGRRKRRTEIDNNASTPSDRITVWNYSEAVGSKGLLGSITLREGETESQTIAYAYDAQHFNRLTSVTETLLGTPYTTSYSYDDQVGFPLRLKTTTYPTGFSTDREYDATTGRVVQLSHNGTLLWKTEEENVFGQVTQFRYGNGITSKYEYDDRHLLVSQIAGKNGETIQSFSYAYDIFANLATRTDNIKDLGESFTYDHLNRLTDIRLNNVHTGHMAYDALGRMTDKQSDGQQVFSSAQHDYIGPDGQLRPHAVSSATMQDFSPATDCQEITYTMFDKVHHLTIGDFMPTAVSFEYGYDHQRIRMTTTYAAGMTIEKRYCGNCEFVDYGSGDESYTFISGPLGVFAVVEKKVSGVESVHYVLKDNLGSWTTITDAEGTVEREQSFDAWGNARNPETWSGGYNSMPMFNRGFTGHEHLMFGKLINMNGRMYDPVMSTFLSVDNYVQAPDLSQSFNRYAYCLNNPLRYVDPSGEEFITAAIIIGGAILGAYTGGALANGGNYNIAQWDLNMGTAIGVIGGGVFGGLSSWAGVAVAGAGFAFCNTTAIAASSLAYSTGMYATGKLAGFDYDISVSIGVASYNFTKGEFGYLFKEGNSPWENIGYGLGAITNLSDVYRFATWDVLSKEKKLEVIKQTIGDENVKVEYDKKLSADAQYNKETQTITIGPKGLNRGRGWAQSTLQHEYKHHLDIMNGAGNTSNDILDWYAYCKELHNAEKNGLTIHQHYELIKRATDCGNNVGVSIGRLPNYTLKEWIRSIMYWY